MKKSIGIDVSMDTLDVVLYDDNLHKSKQYENSDKGFLAIEDEILKHKKSNTMISMEATGVYHLKAAVYFEERGYKVSIVNPLIIKRYSEMKMLRAKTDPVDARIIAEYGFNEKSYYFKPKENKREQIAQLLKQINALQKMRTENGNRLHAIKKIPGADETAIAIYTDMKRYLKISEKEAEKRIDQLIRENYLDEYKRLIQIPGVGKRTASIVIAFFGKFENFQNAKQVSSFIGLNPSPKQSGTSVKGKGSISKKGNKYIRKMIYMATLSASRYNKACTELHDRLIDKKKKGRVVLIAVANKLYRQIFAIVKYNRIYSENYKKSNVLC
jgi:transposase